MPELTRAPSLPALVMAGGRIDGEYARVAGTAIKALVKVAGRPVICTVLSALQQMPRIGPVCVVGPSDVQGILSHGEMWEQETDSAIGNLQAGIRRLGAPERLVLCGSDLPAVAPGSLTDFLARVPPTADLCLPVVSKADFHALFPQSAGVYVRLKEGPVTAGSLLLIRPNVVLGHLPLVQRLFTRRKSQAGMAGALGLPTLLRLAMGALSVAELEARLSKLTGCACRAVLGCGADLAFDIDGLPDLEYIQAWEAERKTTSGKG